MGISAHFLGGRYSLVCIFFATFISLEYSGLVQSDIYTYTHVLAFFEEKMGKKLNSSALEKHTHTDRPANAVAATSATAATAATAATSTTLHSSKHNRLYSSTHETHTQTQASYPYTLAS